MDAIMSISKRQNENNNILAILENVPQHRDVNIRFEKVNVNQLTVIIQTLVIVHLYGFTIC